MTRHHIVTKINTSKKIHKERKRLLKKMKAEESCPDGSYVSPNGGVFKISKLTKKVEQFYKNLKI